MKRFDLTNKPNAKTMRKTATIDAAFTDTPFEVETQEGVLTISPSTVDDWDGGYYVAYPSDGTKPYPISPKFIGENYIEV